MQYSGDSYQLDQEKDANTFLVELDKGLRSGKVGEQCESIVRFPRLFEKYPFPILINSAFLKLADVFREGTNLMRLCVLKVTQQSEKHLDKILNVDEFLQRIFYVIHSNDPVARAITLRTLGSAAHVIAERKNVHHSIINSMDSNDSVELEAAIYAAEKFAAQSKSFASSICGKFSEMIEGLVTPFETKLKLIAIFQHMHHEPSTTSKAREVCTGLLPSYPSRGFVLVTLHVLSQLAAKSLLDIPAQVSLLLEYMEKDGRKAVKVLALQDLCYLAHQAPHMWTTQQIQRVCDYALCTTFGGLQLGCLELLAILAKSVAVNNFAIEKGNIIECCNKYSYDTNERIAVKACELYTYLVIHFSSVVSNQESSELVENVSMAVVNFVIIATTNTSQQLTTLKQCLVCVVKLCEAFKPLTDRYVDTIISSLATVPGSVAVVLCECLAAISTHQNDLLHSLLPDLIRVTTGLIQSANVHDKLITLLVTLMFQAYVGESLESEVTEVVNQVLSCVNYWVAYKLGRQATRYGHHRLAADIFTQIMSQVNTETSSFWLSSLRDCCEGESCLQQDVGHLNVTSFLRRAAKAEEYYHRAITALRAATSPSCSMSFQYDFLRLRCDTMECYCELIKACRNFKTSPPPAIATSLAMTTGLEIHRCNHVLSQLQSCRKKFEGLENKYKSLYQSSFDADQFTLLNIQSLQQNCQVVIYVLETIVAKTQGLSSKIDLIGLPKTTELSNVSAQNRLQRVVYEDVFKDLKTVCNMQCALPLTYQHIECIEECAMKLCQLPLMLPRFFFQKLQSTEIKLAISPQPKATEPVTVHFDTQLALKVEGVTQHGQRPGLFRKIKQVKICVSSQQTSKGQMVSESKFTENPDNKMEETVEPHNDYFSCNFLLMFPVAGLHQLDITAKVLDEDESLWNTGPSSVLQVKSYDEGVHRQQQQQYAAQRQQQRAALQQNLSQGVQS